MVCAQSAPPQDSVSDSADPRAQQQPPQQQTPPQTVPGTPTIPKPTIQLPPAPPQSTQPATIPPQHDTEGDYFSIAPLFWLTRSAPVLSPGNSNAYTTPGGLAFPGHSRYGEGLDITVPTGRENSVQFEIFRVSAQGNSVLPVAVNYYGNEFAQGDVLASNYRATIAKLSWNYLTWPYPSKGAKLRIKTLWEVQLAQIAGSYAAPADTSAIDTYGTGRVVFPTLGIGAEYHFNPHVYLNLKGSGFGVPHHADIVDGEGELVGRISHIEAMVGYKYYHFKTSPQASEYYFMTLDGPFLGIRYWWR